MRSGRRCGCATGQPWATWCISRAFGASSARGRTGRRLVWREVHLAQLVAGVVRHNVVGPMAHGKRLDVLDSGGDEFGAFSYPCLLHRYSSDYPSGPSGCGCDGVSSNNERVTCHIDSGTYRITDSRDVNLDSYGGGVLCPSCWSIVIIDRRRCCSNDISGTT